MKDLKTKEQGDEKETSTFKEYIHFYIKGKAFQDEEKTLQDRIKDPRNRQITFWTGWKGPGKIKKPSKNLPRK